MGQYEVKHQADQSNIVVKRTCRIRPPEEACEECRRDAAIYKFSINCKTCARNNRRYELVQVGVGTSLFGADYAIIRDVDVEHIVPLSHVRDIQEERYAL